MANSHQPLTSIHGRRLALTRTGHVLAPEGTLAPSTGTATAASNAATLADVSGVITTEALTTAAGATYTCTLTNTRVAANDIVLASVQFGTATAGRPAMTTVAVSANQVVFIVQNIHASAALNGTLKISFLVIKV